MSQTFGPHYITTLRLLSPFVAIFVTWLTDTRVRCPVVLAAAVCWTQVGQTGIRYVTSVFSTDSCRMLHVDVGSVGGGLAHSHTLWTHDITLWIRQYTTLNYVNVLICEIYLHAASKSSLHSAVFLKQSPDKQVPQFKPGQLISDLHCPLYIKTIL